jgi:tetratricopeptide (TPR) repeat protein
MDNDPAIRVQYVRSLVEKGKIWEKDDPEKAIAAYDDVIRRFGEDQSPAIRMQLLYALQNKASAVEQSLTLDKTTIDNFVSKIIQRFGERTSRDKIEYSSDLRDTCQKRDVPALLAAYGETDHHLKNKEKFLSVLLGKCQPDVQALVAVYDEIDRRFGKDNDPEIKRQAVLTLIKKNNNKWQRRNVQVNLATYDDINKRFGKDDVKVREKIADILLNEGNEGRQQARVNNLWWDTLMQWFGQDDDPKVQVKIRGMFFQKGEILAKKKDYEAAIAVCDEAIRHFGGKDTINFLKRKGELLRKKGDLDAALAVFDDIARFDIPDGYYSERLESIVIKSEILLQQGKYNDVIITYDEVTQRFSKIKSPTFAEQNLLERAAKVHAAAKAQLQTP